MPRATPLVCAVIVSLSFQGGALGDDSADAERASRLNALGMKAHQRGAFDEAIELFQTARELDDRPKYSFNLAQAAYRTGDCAIALEAYQRFLGGAEESEATEMADQRVAELEPQCGAPTRMSSTAVGETDDEETSAETGTVVVPSFDKNMARVSLHRFEAFPSSELDLDATAALSITVLRRLTPLGPAQVDLLGTGMLVLGEQGDRSTAGVGVLMRTPRRLRSPNVGVGAAVAVVFDPGVLAGELLAFAALPVHRNIDLGLLVTAISPDGTAQSLSIGIDVAASF